MVRKILIFPGQTLEASNGEVIHLIDICPKSRSVLVEISSAIQVKETEEEFSLSPISSVCEKEMESS